MEIAVASANHAKLYDEIMIDDCEKIDCYFNSPDREAIIDVFKCDDTSIDVVDHPIDSERKLLRVHFNAPLGQAPALAIFFNTEIFRDIGFFQKELPNYTPRRFQVPYYPTLCAFVSNIPAQNDLYITFDPKNGHALVERLRAAASDIAYVIKTPGISMIMEDEIPFQAAKARLIAGDTPLKRILKAAAFSHG
jgi:hypothetical protein